MIIATLIMKLTLRAPIHCYFHGLLNFGDHMLQLLGLAIVVSRSTDIDPTLDNALVRNIREANQVVL